MVKLFDEDPNRFNVCPYFYMIIAMRLDKWETILHEQILQLRWPKINMPNYMRQFLYTIEESRMIDYVYTETENFDLDFSILRP